MITECPICGSTKFTEIKDYTFKCSCGETLVDMPKKADEMTDAELREFGLKRII